MIPLIFPNIVVPPIIRLNRVFHYKPSILGYPYFWKHPYFTNLDFPEIAGDFPSKKLPFGVPGTRVRSRANLTRLYVIPLELIGYNLDLPPTQDAIRHCPLITIIVP